MATLAAAASGARGESFVDGRAYLPELQSAGDLSSSVLRPDGKSATGTGDPRFRTTVDLNAPMKLHASLRMDGGTISFWVRPQWTSNSPASHTLISARWNDAGQSYLAISEGWWEPAGVGRLYFIASNEDIVDCWTDVRLPAGVWSLLTVTWASGRRGFCRLYVDDELRAVAAVAWTGGKALDEITVGGDTAATDARGRIGQASLAGLKILDHPVTHRDVMQRYRSEEEEASLYRKKWAWLESEDPHRSVAPASPGAAAPVSAVASGFQKVIFDEDMAWASGPAAIDERLKRIAQAGFNVYVPCVWHGSGAWYPSRVAQTDVRLRHHLRRGWDPLAYLVERAHAHGIAVYPWFTVVRREDDANPEWAEPGTPRGAYDVHQPGFQDFAIRMMLDVVSRYDIDGINLDYIRTMGLCISQYCQRAYQLKTGMPLMADYADGAPTAAARRRIESWQDDAVGGLVRHFSERARALKARLVIAVDGNALNATAQRPLEGRDEAAWANNGWIDVFFSMDYRPEIDIAAVRAARAQLTDPGKLWLLVGNFDSIDEHPESRSGTWLAKVMEFARKSRQSKGIGVYLYGLLDDDQIAELGRLR